MMTRDRPVSGPVSWLLRGFGVGPPTGARDLDRRARRGFQGPRPDLVETRTAIDGSVVPWRERYDGLTPAGAADRSMELAWTLARTGALGDRPA